jgi:hypothetical protein
VCDHGFECARRAIDSVKFRPERTLEAADAQSHWRAA